MEMNKANMRLVQISSAASQQRRNSASNANERHFLADHHQDSDDDDNNDVDKTTTSLNNATPNIPISATWDMASSQSIHGEMKRCSIIAPAP